MKYNSKELSTIIIFSSLGAILSVPIGHIGNYLKTIPLLPLVEAVLFSFHGLPVIAMSGIQGIIIDTSLHFFGYNSRGTIIGCGVSALSNVLFIQFIIRLPFPISVYALMYTLSFTSGVLLGAYPSNLLQKMIKTRI